MENFFDIHRLYARLHDCPGLDHHVLRRGLVRLGFDLLLVPCRHSLGGHSPVRRSPLALHIHTPLQTHLALCCPCCRRLYAQLYPHERHADNDSRLLQPSYYLAPAFPHPTLCHCAPLISEAGSFLFPAPSLSGQCLPPSASG